MTTIDRPAEWDVLADEDDRGRYVLGTWVPDPMEDGCTGVGCAECGSGCDRDYGDD